MNASWLWQDGTHESYVIKQKNGYVAGYGLKQCLDPNGTSGKQELFQDVREALRFAGYPVDILGIPKELS
jgi:hypothetical protein